MTPISELLNLCKCGIQIEINIHRDYYMSASDALDELNGEEDQWKSETDLDVWQKMIDTDTIISIQAYPDTPIGFYRIYHYDIDMAIQRMIEILKS
jgi:hypothetical protein